MTVFQYLKAKLEEQRQSSATPPLRTVTPITDLTQASRVDIANVPVILARDAGSLVEMLSGSNLVSMIGGLRLPLVPSFVPDQGYINFFRVYLSQSSDTDLLSFISIAVKPAAPTQIIELRLYRPYNEIVPADTDEWAFWLLDDTDPDKGGMIGCPVIQGKDTDGSIPYQRSWNPSGLRVQPYQVDENILDMQGGITRVRHTMMHYQRSLTDPKLSEYMLVSAMERDNDEASVAMWLGIDLDRADVTAYPPPR